jgi:polysaccharide chain length determinant protein (PEP-CTERM system associated)
MSVFTREYQYYLRLVSLRKKLFFVVALLGMTVAVITAYSLPRKYEAKTTIFIEQNVITDLVKGIAISPSMQTKIKNLAVSLVSRTMLLQILKQLDKDLDFKGEADQEVYIKDLQDRVVVNLNEKQGLLIISFRDKDPVFARDFVNTMARVYIEQNTSTKREESTDATNFLGEQIKVFKKRVDDADEAINKFKSEKGLILSTDETFLRGEINAAQQKIEELEINRTELESKWDIMGPGKGAVRKGVNPNQQEAELKRLLAIYTEKNPKVIKARAALRASQDGRPDPGPSKEAVEATRTGKLVQLQIDAIKSMEDHEKKVVEDSKALLREMPMVKAALAELVGKKEQEANIYNQLVARYGQSEISKQMEINDKSTTFRIVDPAVIPEFPTSPNRPAVILAGIILSIGAGIGSTYLADRLNRSIRSLQELKTIGLPIFAVIPLIANEEENLRQVKRDKLVTVLAGSYFAVILAVLLTESLKLMGWAPALRGLSRHIL